MPSNASWEAFLLEPLNRAAERHEGEEKKEKQIKGERKNEMWNQTKTKEEVL